MNHGIDIHTHIVPEQFPAYAGTGRDVPWPSMAHDHCGHASVVISGKNYRTVPSTCWDCTARTRGMDEQRIARQVLSPMPELLSYWLPLDAGQQICRHLNETIASMVSRDPTRFTGLGAVPLQDVDAGIAELEFVMRSLKLSGVEIATHINGVSIGDPKFDPFFTVVESLGAAVFVHGLRPAGKDRLVGPAALEQVVAFPGDVALAAASLITGGMLERHPHLRIALSHGGGAMAMVLPRLEHGWKTAQPIKDSIPRAPSEYAKRLYADSLVYDPHALRAVIRTFGEDKVMIGTDFPFVIADPNPHGSIDAIAPSSELALALREGNARRFLGLTN